MRHTESARLLEALETLPPVDSGPLEDRVLARAGDDLAALLEREDWLQESLPLAGLFTR